MMASRSRSRCGCYCCTQCRSRLDKTERKAQELAELICFQEGKLQAVLLKLRASGYEAERLRAQRDGAKLMIELKEQLVEVAVAATAAASAARLPLPPPPPRVVPHRRGCFRGSLQFGIWGHWLLSGW